MSPETIRRYKVSVSLTALQSLPAATNHRISF